MVSSKAKTVSIVFRAELTAVDEPVIRQNENPARGRTRWMLRNDGKGPSGQTGGGRQRFINHSRRQRYQP
jgi:hypothetical protein